MCFYLFFFLVCLFKSRSLVLLLIFAYFFCLQFYDLLISNILKVMGLQGIFAELTKNCVNQWTLMNHKLITEYQIHDLPVTISCFFSFYDLNLGAFTYWNILGKLVFIAAWPGWVPCPHIWGAWDGFLVIHDLRTETSDNVHNSQFCASSSPLPKWKCSNSNSSQFQKKTFHF